MKICSHIYPQKAKLNLICTGLYTLRLRGEVLTTKRKRYANVCLPLPLPLQNICLCKFKEAYCVFSTTLNSTHLLDLFYPDWLHRWRQSNESIWNAAADHQRRHLRLHNETGGMVSQLVRDAVSRIPLQNTNSPSTPFLPSLTMPLKYDWGHAGD